MNISFEGKVAIVTGAGGGLGRCHALDLARRGAKVVVNDLGGSPDGTGGNSAASEAVVKEIEEMGGEAIANGASVTDVTGMENMVKDVMAKWGRIDILINNAGILRDKTFSKMPLEDFDLVVQVHLMGTVIPTKAVWEIMREQGYGRIVNTTSSSGIFGNFGQSNYGAAKSGVVGFMNTLKLEGQKNNIRVNTLAPIAFTRMTESLFPAGADEMMKPEFVTPAVMFMVSEDAPTGVIISAGAGFFAAAQMMESEGISLGKDVTAEDVATNWEKISDMSNAKGFFNNGEQTGKIFEVISKAG
ncbi:MAG: SDR family NAD(P)-dependent oxidoreductase [Alphaproteobacteria bacterium]